MCACVAGVVSLEYESRYSMVPVDPLRILSLILPLAAVEIAGTSS
jgi:hypothetical protein